MRKKRKKIIERERMRDREREKDRDLVPPDSEVNPLVSLHAPSAVRCSGPVAPLPQLVPPAVGSGAVDPVERGETRCFALE